MHGPMHGRADEKSNPRAELLLFSTVNRRSNAAGVESMVVESSPCARAIL